MSEIRKPDKIDPLEIQKMNEQYERERAEAAQAALESQVRSRAPKEVAVMELAKSEFDEAKETFASLKREVEPKFKDWSNVTYPLLQEQLKDPSLTPEETKKIALRIVKKSAAIILSCEKVIQASEKLQSANKKFSDAKQALAPQYEQIAIETPSLAVSANLEAERLRRSGEKLDKNLKTNLKDAQNVVNQANTISSEAEKIFNKLR